jgi:hypothetical protein
MAIDDKGNLNDLHAAGEALMKAKHALQAAMVGQGPSKREAFIFYVGMARGRLSRIVSRIDGETVAWHPDDEAIQ